MAFDGLIDINGISTRVISQKKSSDHTLNINKNELEDYIAKGWEPVPNKLKTKETVKKPKKHFDHFEDRIWALLAKMKVKSLNKDNQFKIEYKTGLTKQIDVFSVDNEIALVCECKSSAERKRGNYSTQINEIIGIKEHIRAKIRSQYGTQMKVAFIFATNNSIISNKDKERLSSEKIHHLNQDDFDYYEQLTDQLGSAAKYQLYARLFSGQKIPGLKNRVPAVQGKMKNGQLFYSFSVEPEFLLKIGFVLHRVEATPDNAGAYQRLVKKKRLTDIGKFVDNGGYFPNSIIVNIETKNGKSLKFEKASNDHDSSTSLGVLHLPQVYKSAFIIDGQHRLIGYSRASDLSNHLLPVVAFCNLDYENQSKIFVDINSNQAAVAANVLKSIMAEFNWDSDDASLAISALKTRVLSDINYDEKSALYKRIVLSEEKRSSDRCLTLKTLVDWGFGKSDFFGKTKGSTLVKTGTLFCGDYKKTLTKSIDFFNCIFWKFEEDLPVQWALGNEEGGFIAMNNGITGILRVTNDITNYLISNKSLKAEDFDGEKLAQKVIPYLEPVISFIDGLNSEGIKKLRSLFGGGAPEKIQREFQNAIHQTYQDFCPEGLEQWVKDHSGQFNALCYELGTQIEQGLLHDHIVSCLKHKFGQDNWWDDGVHPNIQGECSLRRIAKKSKEHDSCFLDLIDYRKIIEENWDLLGNKYTPPSLEQAAKKKRLEWLVRFNTIRQKYSHPQRESTTEEEYEFLKDIDKWLGSRVSD